MQDYGWQAFVRYEEEIERYEEENEGGCNEFEEQELVERRQDTPARSGTCTAHGKVQSLPFPALCTPRRLESRWPGEDLDVSPFATRMQDNAGGGEGGGGGERGGGVGGWRQHPSPQDRNRTSGSSHEAALWAEERHMTLLNVFALLFCCGPLIFVCLLSWVWAHCIP